jgi:hypothetical protein
MVNFLYKIGYKTRDIRSYLHSNSTVNSYSKSSSFEFNPTTSQCE